MEKLNKLDKNINDILIKIDDFREERIEDFIAEQILFKWDNFKNADDIRTAALLAVIKAANIYVQSYGVPALTDDVQRQIAKKGAKVFKVLNNKMQKQLRKKSKSYRQRHGEQDNGQNKQT